MVCPRCIKVVSDELQTLGLEVKNIELGKVELRKSISPEVLQQVKSVMEKNGFELAKDITNLLYKIKKNNF